MFTPHKMTSNCHDWLTIQGEAASLMMSSMRSISYYCIQERVLLYSKVIIYLIVSFGFQVHIKLFKCIHAPNFLSYTQYNHNMIKRTPCCLLSKCWENLGLSSLCFNEQTCSLKRKYNCPAVCPCTFC